MGFMLANTCNKYIGFDPSPVAHKGVNELFRDLSEFVEPHSKQAQLTQIPFENASIKDDSVDFALTSPPYYDLEKYEGKFSSWNKFKTFEEWVDGFYYPLIAKVSLALKPEGFFALQVGSQRWPLRQMAIDYAQNVNLGHKDTILTGMGKAREDGEVIVILQKNA